MDLLGTYLGNDIIDIIKYLFDRDEWNYLNGPPTWNLIDDPLNFGLKLGKIDLLKWYWYQLPRDEAGKITDLKKYKGIQFTRCSDITKSGKIEIVDFFVEIESTFQWNCSDALGKNKNNFEVAKYLRKLGFPLGSKDSFRGVPKFRKWYMKEAEIEILISKFRNAMCRENGFCNCFLHNIPTKYILDEDTIEQYYKFVAYVSSNFNDNDITDKKIIEYAIEFDKLYPSYFRTKPTLEVEYMNDRR